MRHEYKENNGHRYARIFRKVRGVTMGDSSPPFDRNVALAEYDPERNIVYINADVWDEVSPSERENVFRPSTFEVLSSTN